jgi:hypothetical protein
MGTLDDKDKSKAIKEKAGRSKVTSLTREELKVASELIAASFSSWGLLLLLS